MTAALPLSLEISAAQIAQARASAKQTNRKVVHALEAQLQLGPFDYVRALGHTLQLNVGTLSEVNEWEPEFGTLSFADSVKRGCILAHSPEGLSHLVFSDPFDEALFAWQRFHEPARTLVLVHESELTAWFARCEEGLKALQGISEGGASVGTVLSNAEEISLASIGDSDSPIVQFVNSTLYDALKTGASDIHFESHATGLVVKFRRDGVLGIVGQREGIQTAEQILSRIKVMAELDIAERRVPQDGRIQVVRSGRGIDVRVSVMPSVHGEDAVLRILDRQALADDLSGLTLAALGLTESTTKTVRRLARLPYGMLLVTGPTGSGKTTTLYAALSETHNPEEKTITIEDPVEYQLPGVLQIPVNEKKGLTFARGLRSILRHDPDRILVGEIRDAETAQIAVQSALTGHLVFTTVHANNVLDVFGRFQQFGLDLYSFVSALNGILAQRLLRRLCPHCARPGEPSPAAIEDAQLSADQVQSGSWRRVVGCAHCLGTGYKGRFAIGEVLKLDGNLRSLIAERASLMDIESAARRAGLTTLHEEAVRAAAAGATTLEEVNRVTAA